MSEPRETPDLMAMFNAAKLEQIRRIWALIRDAAPKRDD
jgi:hypothetical protein